MGYLKLATFAAVALAAWSCTGREGPTKSGVATTARGLDTDTDGMDDGWETTHFGNLSRDGTADFDGDDILDLEEFEHGSTRASMNRSEMLILTDTLTFRDTRLSGSERRQRCTVAEHSCERGWRRRLSVAGRSRGCC